MESCIEPGIRLEWSPVENIGRLSTEIGSWDSDCSHTNIGMLLQVIVRLMEKLKMLVCAS